jgi:RecJ-like exonuclease
MAYDDCPNCQGTGLRPYSRDVCSVCQGTGIDPQALDWNDVSDDG